MPQFGNDERGLGVSDDERRARQAVKAKRAPDALEKKWAAEDHAELEVAERMMAPPVVVETRCHVCSGPFAEYRFYIERQLMKNRSYRAIALSIPADPKTGKQLSHRSIANHVNGGHMPIDQAAIRAIMEDQADLLQQSYEDGVRGSFTTRGALDNLIRKGYQDAMDGITTIEPRDLVQLAKLHNDLNTDSGTVAMEEAKAVVRIYTDAIKEILQNGDIVDQEIALQIKNAIVFEVQRMVEIEKLGSAIDSRLELAAPEVVEDATVLDSQ
jgi:hypothetical protein